MGEPIPEDPEYGDDCDCLCNDDEPFFEPGKTPRYVYLTMDGFPSPTGHNWKLEQDPIDHCLWEWHDDVWQAHWSPCWPDPPRTIFRLAKNGIGVFGKLGDYPPCQVSVENDINGGFGTMTYEAAVKSIANQMHFDPSPDSKFDLFTVDDEYQVIRLHNTKTPTNQHILIKCVDFYHPP